MHSVEEFGGQWLWGIHISKVASIICLKKLIIVWIASFDNNMMCGKNRDYRAMKQHVWQDSKCFTVSGLIINHSISDHSSFQTDK